MRDFAPLLLCRNQKKKISHRRARKCGIPSDWFWNDNEPQRTLGCNQMRTMKWYSLVARASSRASYEFTAKLLNTNRPIEYAIALWRCTWMEALWARTCYDCRLSLQCMRPLLQSAQAVAIKYIQISTRNAHSNTVEVGAASLNADRKKVQKYETNRRCQRMNDSHAQYACIFRLQFQRQTHVAKKLFIIQNFRNNRVANLNLCYTLTPGNRLFCATDADPSPINAHKYKMPSLIVPMLAFDTPSFVFVLLNLANGFHNIVAPRRDRQHLHILTQCNGIDGNAYKQRCRSKIAYHLVCDNLPP